MCGACTVLIDGEPVRSCITLAVAAEGADIRTLEGLQGDPLMEVLKHAFHDKHGLQCGFCTPGMLIAARDLLQRRGMSPRGNPRRHGRQSMPLYGISGDRARDHGGPG